MVLIHDPPLAASNVDGMTSAELLGTIEDVVLRYKAADAFTEFSKNRLTLRGAQLYCQQHGLFTRHSRRMWAYVVGNCPEVEVRRFIVRENLFEEEGNEEISHYVKMRKMGEALGLTAGDMNDAVPLDSTRAALLIWETLTKDRHWLVGAAAKAALEMKGNPAAEGQRWMDKLGLTREQCDFWMMHQDADAVHGPVAMTLVLKYLSRSPTVSNSEVLDGVIDSFIAFRIFRDGIAEAAETPAASEVAS